MNPNVTQVQVTLFSTSACHLCEEAEAILLQAEITFLKSEILDEGKLFDEYGFRIPVLKRSDNGEELDWPFDAASVNQFLVL